MLLTFGSTDNAEYFDRVRSTLYQDRYSNVTETIVAGADHDFLLPEHATEMTEIVRDWLDEYFLRREEVTLDASGDRHTELPYA